jgi:hypothetical protein
MIRINPMVHYDEHVDVCIVMVMVRNAAFNNMSVNVWLLTQYHSSKYDWQFKQAMSTNMINLDEIKVSDNIEQTS